LSLHGDLKITQSNTILVTPKRGTKQLLSAYSEQVKQEIHVHWQFRMLAENIMMDTVPLPLLQKPFRNWAPFTKLA
jgi:hypothetical protein